MKRTVLPALAGMLLIAATVSAQPLPSTKFRPNALTLPAPMKTSIAQVLPPGTYDLDTFINEKGKLMLGFYQAGRKVGETAAELKGFGATPQIGMAGNTCSKGIQDNGLRPPQEKVSGFLCNGRPAQGTAIVRPNCSAADGSVRPPVQGTAPIVRPNCSAANGSVRPPAQGMGGGALSFQDLGFGLNSPVMFNEATSKISILAASGPFAGRGSIQAELRPVP